MRLNVADQRILARFNWLNATAPVATIGVESMALDVWATNRKMRMFCAGLQGILALRLERHDFTRARRGGIGVTSKTSLFLDGFRNSAKMRCKAKIILRPRQLKTKRVSASRLGVDHEIGFSLTMPILDCGPCRILPFLLPIDS